MISSQTLLGVLTRGEAPRKRGTGWRVVAAVLGVLLLAFYVGIALYNLRQSWETGDWFGFWSGGGSGFFLVLVVIFIGGAVAFSSQVAWLSPADQEAGARALREAAATGDDRIAPYTDFQPALIPPEEMPQGETRIASLKRPLVPRSNSAVIAVVVVFFLFLAFILPLLFDGIDNNFSLPGRFPSFDVLFPLIFVFYFVCLILAIVLGVRARRGRAFAVEVDSQGVRWRRGARRGDQAEIRWDQMRSLFRLGGTLGASVATVATSDTYVLDSEGASLVWTVPATASAAEFAASEALLRLIVTRSGQPLRDLSKVADAVVRSGRNAGRIWSARLPVASGPLSGSATRPQAGPPSGPLAPFPALLATPAARQPRRVGWWLAGGTIVLLFAVVYGGGAWVQYEQPIYLASLPARIHAETPLYQDNLSTPDSDWPVQYPSTGIIAGNGFAGSGYQLYGTKSGDSIEIYGPGTYSDAAVEVTVTETGQPDPNYGDGVGLVLRGDAQTQNFLAYYVTYAGDWNLEQYHYVDSNPSDNWNYLASGHSSAIQTDTGATNRLLALLRGSVINLYVNDQLITTYYDRFDTRTLPTSGRMGLYLNDTALTGTFVNYAVYPVLPPSSLLYV